MITLSAKTHLDDIARLATGLVDEAVACDQRRILVLTGERAWCRQAAEATLGSYLYDEVMWVSDEPPPGAQTVDAARADSLLGRELGAVVYDAFGGFVPNAFGAVAGTLRGGGLLLLLAPPLADWPAYADPRYARITVPPYHSSDIPGRFIQRLVGVLHQDPALVCIAQGADFPMRPAANPPGPARSAGDGIYRTLDQRHAVEGILKVVHGHRRRPLVLTSDRGRGKSAALGIAAAHCLQQGLSRILLTAPRLEAVAEVFAHAARLLPGADVTRGRLDLNGAELMFMAPDELIHSRPAADLLLVDEAAGIPTPLLEILLQHHARIVFATTVHGYEGTGRGFALHFHQVLEQVTPGWRALTLEAPVRWALGDPLEPLVFRALLLDAAIAPEAALATADVTNCEISRLDRDALLQDEALLGELFGLLVIAHYRTSPNDLQNLLDAPHLSVYVMRRGEHVVATALLAEEGGFDEATARAVYLGNRRLRGHLLPQSLAAHAGVEHAPQLHCSRVMRIAVHPGLQGRGLGTQLLAALVEEARRRGHAAIGASFGASIELLRFWQRAGFTPVRLGLTREHTSGAHSALVLQPLNSAGEALCHEARQGFVHDFPHLLTDPLRQLDSLLAAHLLQCPEGVPRQPLTARERRDLEAFAYAQRGYEVTLAALWKLSCTALAEPTLQKYLSEQQQAALITRVLQKRPWPEVVACLQVAGRAAVIDILRAVVQAVLPHFE